ncbi:hypothetical protein TTHERM_00328460 (macronuclear) [Tetrahymena thermophila SB210]|uniref:Uncharacterized protein n=1 Tax=Tetrahymena thermophila (strain SB210) TaxID=312017 RepID=I7MMR6_TETTS|nr:hypothetical protein TTHERM_00328460 [Tetrahymena thermophila SB210]EAS06265.1 hypothetical protein TTHERM_00328460 [Tetrahymena thermophila SB210]|eukprot:XP_001026510.1 hypothetical protein TTHERM_00328460 [Tetrahymena thermophila SB210]
MVSQSQDRDQMGVIWLMRFNHNYSIQFIGIANKSIRYIQVGIFYMRSKPNQKYTRKQDVD